jgi:hypothetical protein
VQVPDDEGPFCTECLDYFDWLDAGQPVKREPVDLEEDQLPF